MVIRAGKDLLKGDGSTEQRNSFSEGIEVAAKDVEQKLLDDRKYYDLGERLDVKAHVCSLSGINDFDYPSLQTFNNGLGILEQQLSSVKKVPLPPELLEQFDQMQCNCGMGLFPEISRAWLAIDSDIYVWNYEDGSDVAYFDGLSEVILAAGLVSPRQGVFQSHIQYLLCLTTPVNIVVLGVSFAENQAGYTDLRELYLQPDPLFSIATDNVHMTSVIGTTGGRIFLCGKDGCIYELAYQARDGWFSRRCRKINHSTSMLSMLVPSFLTQIFSYDDPILQIAADNTRNILYSRTEKGNIQVYDLGDDGNGMKLVTGMNYNSIAVNAQCAVRTFDKRHFQPVIHIAPVPRSDASSVQLVAITESGVRLYFITVPHGHENSRPATLQLSHVRMPPGYAPTASPDRPNLVHSAYYRQGTTILTAELSENSDALWCFSDDTFPFQSQIKETQVAVKIDGRTWCVAEIPDYSIEINVPFRLLSFQWPEPPSVVTQHFLPARRFVLLSAQGSHVITTLRPIEQLRFLLLASGTGESEPLEGFFNLYGVDQASATCLALICQCPEAEKQLAALATHTFFRYGGEPQSSAQAVRPQTGTMTVGEISMNDDPMASYVVRGPAAGGSSHGSFLGTPMARSPDSFSTPNFPSSTMATRPTNGTASGKSGKHDGLLIYLSRILRPLWYFPLTSEVDTPKNGVELWSRLSSNEVSWFLEHLSKLKDFMDSYSNINRSSSPSELGYQFGFTQSAGQPRKQDQAQGAKEIFMAERASLVNIHHVIQISVEALELWRTLCDNEFQSIAATLPQEPGTTIKVLTETLKSLRTYISALDIIDRLKHMSFRDFVLTGQEICNTLINSLMSKYFDDHSQVDAISNHLRSKCPTLFSADDAIFSKARSDYHLRVLEALYIKRLNPELCRQKDFVIDANELMATIKTLQDRRERETVIQDAFELYRQIPHLIDLPWISEQLRSVNDHVKILDFALLIALKRDPQGLALHFKKSGEPREDTLGYEANVMRNEAYRCIIESLEKLLHATLSYPGARNIPNRAGPPMPQNPNVLDPAEAKEMFDKFLKAAVVSGDELFHIALYEWLIGKGLTSQLLEIQSAFLEQYLKDTAAEQHPNNLGLLDLLWKHYERRKKYMAAAKVLMKLAEREGPSLTIHERLEYLSRAIMSTKSCGLISNSMDEGEFLHELEDKLEVAQIQLKIYEEIAALEGQPRSSAMNISEAVDTLNSKLLDVSQLYSDFADIYDLAECKMAIFSCAGHYDPVLVKNTWVDIVSKILDSTAQLSTETRMTTVSQRLIAVGKTYMNHDRYFPLEFLVFHLEKKTCELDWDPTWVFVTFRETGFSVQALFQVYSGLLKAKEPYWQTIGKPLHLLNVMSLLITAFLENPASVPLHERPSLTRSLHEACAGYLVELESMSANIGQVRHLITRYKGLQSRLRRSL